jgi:hypothetical protein
MLTSFVSRFFFIYTYIIVINNNNIYIYICVCVFACLLFNSHLTSVQERGYYRYAADTFKTALVLLALN